MYGASFKAVEWSLNNRELALLIWLGLFLAVMLTKTDVRVSVWRVVVAFCHPKIFTSVVAALVYCVGLIWLGTQIGLWDTSLFNDTVVWFVSVVLVLLFSSNKVGNEHYIRRAFSRAIALTVLIEGAVNLVVLPLPVELVLIPFATVLSLLLVVAESDEEYAPAAKLVNGLLVTIGTGLLLFVVIHTLTSLSSTDWTHVWRLLALPLWLTVGVLPFIYLAGTYAICESTFTRMDFFGGNVGVSRRARRRAKLAFLLGTRCRARLVGDFTGPWPKLLVQAPSFVAACAIVAEFRSARPGPEEHAAMWEQVGDDDEDELLEDPSDERDDEGCALAS